MVNQTQNAPNHISKTLIGLTISLVMPIILVFLLTNYISAPTISETQESTIGLVFMWCVFFLLTAYIVFFEKKSLKSVGLTGIKWKPILTAIGLGILLSMLIPAIYLLLPLLFGDTGSSLDASSQRPFILVLFGIITAAVTEELLFRAYPLERLKAISGNHFLGIALSITAFCLVHLFTWDLYHLIGLVLPLGLILTFIYLKTKNLIFTVIVHFAIDLPLLFYMIIFIPTPSQSPL